MKIETYSKQDCYDSRRFRPQILTAAENVGETYKILIQFLPPDLIHKTIKRNSTETATIMI